MSAQDFAAWLIIVGFVMMFGGSLLWIAAGVIGRIAEAIERAALRERDRRP